LPDPANMGNHNVYPFMRPLYFYLKETPMANSRIQKFVDFVKSDAGQKVVFGEQFVQRVPDSQPLPPDSPVLPPETRTMIQDTIKPPANAPRSTQPTTIFPHALYFGFNSSSAPGAGPMREGELTATALDFLPDIVSRLADERYSGRRIIVVGFSDRKGRAESCERISLRRAQTVVRLLTDELRNRHITRSFLPMGVGSTAATASSDDSDEARALDRKVMILVEPEP